VAAYLGPRFSWDDLGEVLLLSAHAASRDPGCLGQPALGAAGGDDRSALPGWAEAYAPEVGWALGDGQEQCAPDWDAQEAEERTAGSIESDKKSEGDSQLLGSLGAA